MLSRCSAMGWHRLTKSATTIAAMQEQTALQRFAFLAEALNGSGGFRPAVTWALESITTDDGKGGTLSATRRVPKMAGTCHLVPHRRESAENYAARCALALYENHLADACDRFVSFLGRRRPMRAKIEAPLVQLLVKNADMRGNTLDAFFASFALQLKARGSMLLLLDMPGKPGEPRPASLDDQIKKRAVPYLREIAPENVADFEIDSETGLFRFLSINCVDSVDGRDEKCIRTWDAQGWKVMLGERVIAQGQHPFGQCPVIPVTENGGVFPQIGAFAQIADMSASIYNATSGLDEILRSQTFSIPTMQVKADQAASFDPTKMAVVLGTHNLMIYPDERPGFISPDADQAQIYRDVIEDRQEAIKRVSMQESTADSRTASPESGVARRLRFERLNASLSGFARQMQSAELRMWEMFNRALARENSVQVEWPSDFNLIDTSAELDILALFQSTGFPDAVLQAKRLAIVQAEFDAADEETKAALMAALNEAAQQAARPTPTPADPAPAPAA